MEIEKQVLSKAESLALSLPEEGFADDFLAALSNVCKEDKYLDSAYLVLKHGEGGVSLFFAFLFNDEAVKDNQVSERISGLMSKILNLFKDEILADAICLNDQVKLQASIASITAPFYEK